MGNITSEIISSLQFLVPGFVSSWLFCALTSYPKPSQFDRVIQALIFTILIQGFDRVIQALIFTILQGVVSLWPWQQVLALIPLVVALIFGLLLAYFANNDKLHCLLRACKITKETSYASEWFSAFSDNITYIVMHLNDGRRILGWPKEWPTEPNKGYFLLQNACWLDDNNEPIELKKVEGVLINSSLVELVEFMKPQGE